MGTRFTYNSKDPAVNITTWLLLVVAVLGVFARLWTKYQLFRTIKLDDLFIITSLSFCIAQSVLISLAVASGYGNHFRDVPSAEFIETMKDLYSASMLYIASLCFSKLSLAVFIGNLTPASTDHFLARLGEVAIIVWAVVALLGTAFQCALPRPWDFWKGQCFNLTAWHYFICASNIVTDLLILTQSMLLIYRIQTSLRKRLVFASLFLPRLLVVAAIIGEIVLIRPITPAIDPTYDLCDVTILQEIVQCMSILASCWGQLMPFLKWLESNGLRIEGFEGPPLIDTKSSRSQTQLKSRDRTYERNEHPLPIRRDRLIPCSQDWELDSQSSRAQIIRETSELG